MDVLADRGESQSEMGEWEYGIGIGMRPWIQNTCQKHFLLQPYQQPHAYNGMLPRPVCRIGWCGNEQKCSQLSTCLKRNASSRPRWNMSTQFNDGWYSNKHPISDAFSNSLEPTLEPPVPEEPGITNAMSSQADRAGFREFNLFLYWIFT